MAAATEYFSQNGFDVENVSAKRSYDLLCVRDSVQIHVEVKGTQRCSWTSSGQRGWA